MTEQDIIDSFANKQLTSGTVNTGLLQKETTETPNNASRGIPAKEIVSSENIRKYTHIGVNFVDWGIDKLVFSITGKMPVANDETEKAKNDLSDLIADKLIEMNLVKIPFWLMLLFYLGIYIFAKFSAANSPGTKNDIPIASEDEVNELATL